MHSIMSKSSEVCDWSSRRACCDSHQGRRLNILSLKPFRTAPMISPHDTADSFCMVIAPSFTAADGRTLKIFADSENAPALKRGKVELQATAQQQHAQHGMTRERCLMAPRWLRIVDALYSRSAVSGC